MKRAKAGREAERERAKAEREAALAAARDALCGRKPTQSAWDGSYLAVEWHLERNAHDPDSIDIEGCTPAGLTDDCWKTTCKYRGKNAFGGVVLNVNTFYIGRDKNVPNSGRVLKVR